MKNQFDEYFKATNDHDVDKVLSFLSDDFQLHFTEFSIAIDKKSLVDVLGWDKGANGSVIYENLVINANSITGLFTEQNDFLSLIGIKELKATITYEFDQNGKINKQIYTPMPNQPSFQEKLQPVIGWAKENKPEELEELYPQNQIKFNQKMAKRWVQLLQEWRSA